MADEESTETTESTTEQTSEETTAEGSGAEQQTSETDWKAKYEETLGHSRKHETEAKANRAAAKELAALKAADLSDAERLSEERDAANTRTWAAIRRAVTAEVKTVAAGLKFRDPADALKMLDLEALTNDEGEPDDAAVEAALKEIAKNKPYLLTAAEASRSGTQLHGGTGEGANKPQTLDQALAGHYGT